MAVDLAARATFCDEDVLSTCGWSAFTGETFVGLPRVTLVRGTVACRDGKVVGQPDFGRPVRRAAS